MLYNLNDVKINTNLSGKSFQSLLNGEWEIGFVSDNVGLDDENNDEFYYNKTTENPIGNDNDNNNYRAFKNKVTVKLVNGKTVNKHIIHWCPSDNYFCITNSIFWDQFQKSIV